MLTMMMHSDSAGNDSDASHQNDDCDEDDKHGNDDTDGNDDMMIAIRMIKTTLMAIMRTIIAIKMINDGSDRMIE